MKCACLLYQVQGPVPPDESNRKDHTGQADHCKKPQNKPNGQSDIKKAKV